MNKLKQVNKRNGCYLYYCTKCEKYHYWIFSKESYGEHLKYALFYYYCPVCKHIHHFGEKFKKHLSMRGKVLTVYNRSCQIAVNEFREGKVPNLEDCK